jgi:hypothetical protein
VSGRPTVTLAMLALALAACATSGRSKGDPMTPSEASGSADRTTDTEAVQATIAGVSHFVDHKNWPQLQALFAETVQTDYRSLFGGEVQSQPSENLVGAWRKMLTPVVTQHLLGPVEVTARGATATARCHFRAYHVARGTPGGDEWMIAGH